MAKQVNKEKRKKKETLCILLSLCIFKICFGRVTVREGQTGGSLAWFTILWKNR